MRKYYAKKTIILYILYMLMNASSEEKPIKITSICKVINSLDAECDRKTVVRNIGYLIDEGYPIVKLGDGLCYYDLNAPVEKALPFAIKL